jgi:cyclophilin family peptidyl-prolyl cis-trans isomerase
MKRSILFSSIVLIIALSIYSFTLIKTNKAMSADGTKKVCISTSYGDIKIKLYNETPKHRDNFIKLAKEAYFDGTLFHRVIKDFMIQGGDPTSKNADSTAILGNGGPTYTIPAEIFFDTVTNKTPAGIEKKEIILKHYHKKGALCAARTENPAKESSGSQFYIVQGQIFSDSIINKMEANYNTAKHNQHITDYLLKPENINLKNEVIKYQSERNAYKLDSIIKIITPIIDKQFANEPKFAYTKEQRKSYGTIGGTPHLDCNYTVFGEVYEGLDVIDKIAAVKTGANDRPVKDIKMTVKVIE